MFTCPPSSAVRPPPRKLVSSNRHPPSLDDDDDGAGVNLDELEGVGLFSRASEKSRESAVVSNGFLEERGTRPGDTAHLHGGPTGFTTRNNYSEWWLRVDCWCHSISIQNENTEVLKIRA